MRDKQSICDGRNLQKRYVGPPFRDEAWTYITGNAERQSGYVFEIHCKGMNGYVIDVQPDRGDLDGTRHFCSGRVTRTVGCGRNGRVCATSVFPCSQ